MKKYHLFLEKEKKITELNSIIWRHPYISLKAETAAKEKLLLEKQQILKKQITILEPQRKEIKKLLSLEQEVFRKNSTMVTQSKESYVYRQSKTEKNISEKFLTHYQKEMDELGLKQKKYQEQWNKLEEEKNNFLKELQENKNHFVEQTASPQKEYDKLLTEQNLLLESLDADFVAKIEQLRQKKIFPSVVAITESRCSSCSMSIAPQMFQIVHFFLVVGKKFFRNIFFRFRLPINVTFFRLGNHC